MRSLTPELLAAQRSASAVPYVKVVVRDRIGGVRRLSYSRHYAGSEPDGYHAAAMPSDGSLIRARVSGGRLYYQRVTSPSATSDFSSWTDLSAAASADVALCAEGSRVLLFYIDTDGVTIKVRESTDNGATLGTAVTAASASGSVTWLAADVKSSGDVLLLYNVGATVYKAKRTTGSWGAPAAWTNSAASIEGIACYYQGDYNCAVAGTDSAGDALLWTFVYGDGFSQTLDTWSALRELTKASSGTGVSFHAPFIAQPDTYRMTFVEKYAGSASYMRPSHTYAPANADFAFNLWREPLPFDLTSEFGQAIAFSVGAVWLSTPSGVWEASLSIADLEVTADVVSLTCTDEPLGGRARIVLRNDDARYSPPQSPIAVGAELRISRGYMTSAGARSSSGPSYWIEGIEHRSGGGEGTLVIEASDAWSLLESWRARRQHTWAAGEQNIVGLMLFVFSRAGVEFASIGGSTTATDLYPSFTVHPGKSGQTVVRRLLAMLPDEIFTRGEFAFLTEPLASEATDYEYGTETGSGDHALLAGKYGDLAAETNRVQVFGDSLFGERFDWPEIEAVHDRLRQVDDRNLTTVAEVEDRADAVLRKAEIRSASGEITVPVNCGQELYDVVEVTDAVAGLSAAKRRVLGLALEYATGERAVYRQRIALGAV